jgi:hypothetical protein
MDYSLLVGIDEQRQELVVGIVGNIYMQLLVTEFTYHCFML